MWDKLETKIRNCKPISINKNDFIVVLKEEWYKIDKSVLIKLVKNMPNKINDVIKNKGNPTKY